MENNKKERFFYYRKDTDSPGIQVMILCDRTKVNSFPGYDGNIGRIWSSDDAEYIVKALNNYELLTT